jgi:hypothetical protein
MGRRKDEASFRWSVRTSVASVGPPRSLCLSRHATSLAVDLLDRGDEELQCLELIENLAGSASRAGGSVIVILGNHEVMQAMGDFRYASPEGTRGFSALRTRLIEDHPRDWAKVVGIDEESNPGLRERAAAFLPGGLWARKLSRFPIAAMIHGTVFVHGSLSLSSVSGKKWPFRNLSIKTGEWLRGERENPPTELFGPESLIWSRQYGKPVGYELGEDDARELSAALDALGAQRLVVGHTPQRPGINGAGQGAVWRVDTGMVMGGEYEVLEVTRFFEPGAKEPKRLGATRLRILTAAGPVDESRRRAPANPATEVSDNQSYFG